MTPQFIARGIIDGCLRVFLAVDRFQIMTYL